MSTLLAIRGHSIGLKFTLGERTLIGRAPDCNIQLLGHRVSRNHCELLRKGRSFTIRDLDSRNGIQVNGQPVKEKILLRNDRIDIGDSTFLFDSDHDLKNTRFSNKLVYLSPSQDDTIQDHGTPVTDADLKFDAQSAIQNLEALTGLFAPGSEDSPLVMQQALDTVMKLFKAETGCILLWDEVTAELQPVVASAEAEHLALSRQVIATVFRERQAILTSNERLDTRYLPEAEPSGSVHSVLCVPLMFKEQTIGVLHLERIRLAHFALEDVRQLQAVANLVAAAIVQSVKAKQSMASANSGLELVGKSPAFKDITDHIRIIARHDSSVLITGETGTGKELLARAIHHQSARSRFPFIAINCAAIPDTLFESELFGHERGAFTGAEKMTIGKIEAAHGGTLFLDEIGELALHVQPKLLRFLQEKSFHRVGGTKSLSVDVRIVTATNIDLMQAVKNKKFREDLYYRLAVVNIHAPALRDRRSDIPLLAEHFARKLSAQYGRSFLGFTDQAIIAMEKYPWPGNVRELQNAVERAIMLSNSGVLGEEFMFPRGATLKKKSDDSGENLQSMREMEESLIRRALKESGGNQAKAADLLKIHRNTIRNKIQEYGIDPLEP